MLPKFMCVRYDDSVSRFAREKIHYFGFEALLDRMEQKDQIANSGERLAKQSGLVNKI